MANTDVWLQERVEGGGRITAGAVVEQSGGASRRPWFRVSESIRLAITHRADPFVAGASFAALREGGGLTGHDAVSPSPLRNVDELQSA